MKDQTDSHDNETNYNGDTERAVGPIQPLIRPNSGLYEWSFSLTLPQPTPIPVVPHLPVNPGDPLQPGGGASSAEEATDEFAGLHSAALTMQREELRLDVDGYFPQ